jgi:hypothetical protein
MKPTTLWAVAMLAVGAALTGCATPRRATVQQLRVRAAFDLSCPHAMVQLYQLDERTRGAVGCGRRFTYVEYCGDVGATGVCTWLLDYPPQGQTPPAAAHVGAQTVLCRYPPGASVPVAPPSQPSAAVPATAAPAAAPPASTAAPEPTVPSLPRDPFEGRY